MSWSDLLPVVLGALLVGAAAGFALWPLVKPRSAAVSNVAPDPSAARFELYRQVLDLEQDVQTGKLAPEDFEVLRRDLLARAAVDLRSTQAVEQTIDDEVEREIAAARQALSGERQTRSSQEVVST